MQTDSLLRVPPGPGTPGTWSWVLPWLPAVLVWLAVLGFIAHTGWRFRREQTRQRVTDQFASPLAGALFALLALVAGTISQFYPGEITGAFPLSHAGRSPVSAALGFWVSIVLLAFLGIAYYAATGRQRLQEVAILQNDSRDLRLHTTELVNTLRTLPPEGFMRDYPTLCADMLAAYTRAVAAPTPELIREGIRIALHTAALMAHRFGRRGAVGRYRANLMRFQDVSALEPMSSWDAADRELYPAGFEPAVIRGALVFDPALATRASSERAEALEGAQPLRIAIPDPPRDLRAGSSMEGRLRVLPGSAVAFLLGKPFIAHNTLDIRPARGEYDLPEAVIRAAETYFRTGDGRDVRSFVSLPLFIEPGRMEGETIGVLNVEFEDVHIFDNDARTVEQFALSIAPVHFVIVWLLTLLEEMEAPSLV
jgi:hypothetical protein